MFRAFLMQYTTLPLDIVPGITIALQLYNIFHPAKPPSSVTLAKDTLQTVKVRAACVCVCLQGCVRLPVAILPPPSVRVHTAV
ncbi:hypothetical protein EON66_03175 [archaeon]|nr:MAG: hypothetical protein EON66_03175 [archaeon]